MKLLLAAWIALAAGVAPTAPAASAQRASDARSRPGLAEFHADLEHFRGSFLAVDRSFSAGARAQAISRLAALESALATMTPARFELEIARIVALADNGHTNAAPVSRAQRYNRVPVRLVPFGEDFYVVRAPTGHADLLGARLVAIGAHPIDGLRYAARALMGGVPAFRDRAAPLFLESPELLHATGLGDNSRVAVYVFQLANGERASRELSGDPPVATGPVTTPRRALYPAPPAREDANWRGLLAPANAPWALHDPDVRFRWREAPELDAVVVEFRQNVSSPGHDLAQFIHTVEAELRTRRPRHLVLDMRMNGGGDLNRTRDFMRRLPTLVRERIFVLTSPWTFSAAISSIGYLKQAAPARVTIVGESVGDRLEFWAEGHAVTLPRTGIQISFSTERHDYATGCRPYTDCHGPVVREPISVHSLAPDIAAPWTIETYAAGRDPAMEAVARSVGR